MMMGKYPVFITCKYVDDLLTAISFFITCFVLGGIQYTVYQYRYLNETIVLDLVRY